MEIRHVETGAMSQIIQGNNLRILFADTPPSTTHSASQHQQYNPYQQGYAYNQYGQQSPYGSRPSLNGYGGQASYTNPYQPPPPRPHSTAGRDEILMVSDDRVMRLQMASPTPMS